MTSFEKWLERRLNNEFTMSLLVIIALFWPIPLAGGLLTFGIWLWSDLTFVSSFQEHWFFITVAVVFAEALWWKIA